MFSNGATPGEGRVMPGDPAQLQRIDIQEVRRAAVGRWPTILTSLGIPPDALSKRNKPCPCCGGTDRFSFIDRDFGRFVCRSLDRQGGDGFTLVMHWLDCDFPTAIQAVTGVLSLSAESARPSRPVTSTTTPHSVTRDDSAKLARLWAEASPISAIDPVGYYLANRGLLLQQYPASLRYHPRLPYWCEVDGKPVCLGTFPAMLAEVTAPDSKRVALHRLYLTADGYKAQLVHPMTGEPLDAKKLLTAREGAMRGAAVRLYAPVAGMLGLTEGNETALAVHLGSGLPVWACVSAWGLSNIALPDSVTDVWVFGDHDTSGTGQRAADSLACQLIAEGRRVRVVIPEQAGVDWLDVYQSHRQEVADGQ